MNDLLKMFGLVIRSLFKKPACDMYPVNQPKFYDATKGHIEIDKNKCILCTLCDKKCPTSAIKVDRENGKWEIDYGKCILCNRCIEACPPKCLTNVNQYAAPFLKKTINSVDVPKKTKE